MGYDGVFVVFVYYELYGEISIEVICLGFMECIGNESLVLYCLYDEWKIFLEECEVIFGIG